MQEPPLVPLRSATLASCFFRPPRSLPQATLGFPDEGARKNPNSAGLRIAAHNSKAPDCRCFRNLVREGGGRLVVELFQNGSARGAVRAKDGNSFTGFALRAPRTEPNAREPRVGHLGGGA